MTVTNWKRRKNIFGEAIAGGDLSNTTEQWKKQMRRPFCLAINKKSLSCDSHSSAVRWGGHSALNNN